MNLRETLDLYFNRKLEDRIKFQGLDISIETDKGSTREGIDKNGHAWKIQMKHPYGYIRMSEGSDGEHVDCYVGGNHDANMVYIIHQLDPDTGKFDEDKCMLGFDSADEAKAAYLAHYDKPGFFGSMDEMSMDEFKNAVLATKENPGMIEANNFGRGMGIGALFIDAQPTHHPPSLTKPYHVPRTDDPNETDDKFLDVTKRDSPEEQKWRDKLTVKKLPKPLSWNRVYQPVTQESISMPYGTVLRGRR